MHAWMRQARIIYLLQLPIRVWGSHTRMGTHTRMGCPYAYGTKKIAHTRMGCPYVHGMSHTRMGRPIRVWAKIRIWYGTCSIPYAYFIPYPNGIYHTRMAYTIRVWYNRLYYTRMVQPIRVWLYHTRMMTYTYTTLQIATRYAKEGKACMLILV